MGTEKRGHQAGFTLIEVLVVLAIIGILSAIAAPRLIGARVKARQARVDADLDGFATAAGKLYNDTGQYPLHLDDKTCISSKAVYVTDCSVGILCTDGSFPGWNGPYLLASVGKDPWGNPYIFDSDYKTTAAEGRAFVSGGPNKSGLKVFDSDNSAIFLCGGPAKGGVLLGPPAAR